MTVWRILAIVLIFVLGWVGWVILGTTSTLRSGATGLRLDAAVQGLWGGPIVQEAPRFRVQVPGRDRQRPVLPVTNHIEVSLQLEQRRKGLIWYPTYVVDFDARYGIANATPVAEKVRVHFRFPSPEATYDGFKVWQDGTPLDLEANAKDGIRHIMELAPGATGELRVAYRTRGLREWRYRMAPDGGRVRGLAMEVQTDFAAVDFPEGSLSPMTMEPKDDGMLLRWQADDLLTRQDVAVTMPERLNPGPLAARMSFFAPVCLGFFFVLVTSIGILRRVEIHPMHYLFVTAGFFAFHLLFAYQVDLIDVHLAFAISALVSVGLVVVYLRAALGPGFPWPAAALGQFFYLVLFSYSFFLEGMTGFTVTLGSVLTLAVLMAMTARLDWGQVFGKRQPL